MTTLCISAIFLHSIRRDLQQALPVVIPLQALALGEPDAALVVGGSVDVRRGEVMHERVPSGGGARAFGPSGRARKGAGLRLRRATIRRCADGEVSPGTCGRRHVHRWTELSREPVRRPWESRACSRRRRSGPRCTRPWERMLQWFRSASSCPGPPFSTSDAVCHVRPNSTAASSRRRARRPIAWCAHEPRRNPRCT